MNEALSDREAWSRQSIERAFRPDHRRLIRLTELELVLPWMKPGSRVLEIGAGAGWQARFLTDLGFRVEAIDVPGSNYNALREWEVTEYDGRKIPLPDESVDMVFSSNVLEHIPHIHEFQAEMQRVLKQGGLAIHVMPTSTWRLWTFLSFYVRRICSLAGKQNSGPSLPAKPTSPTTTKEFLGKIRNIFFPQRHGVRGNVITEAYFFSELYWKSVFRNAPWTIKAVKPNHLFYSGNRILGSSLDLEIRRWLSRVLGSSCKVYVLEKSE